MLTIAVHVHVLYLTDGSLALVDGVALRRDGVVDEDVRDGGRHAHPAIRVARAPLVSAVDVHPLARPDVRWGDEWSGFSFLYYYFLFFIFFKSPRFRFHFWRKPPFPKTFCDKVRKISSRIHNSQFKFPEPGLFGFFFFFSRAKKPNGLCAHLPFPTWATAIKTKPNRAAFIFGCVKSWATSNCTGKFMCLKSWESTPACHDRHLYRITLSI